MYIRLVLLALFGTCCLMQSPTHADAQQPEAKKVVLQPKSEPETRGAPSFTAYELVFPVIETHRHVSLIVAGKNVKWSQEFEDGAEPFFNALEEEFEPGIYGYKIEYTANEIGRQRRQRHNDIKDRRELLKRRADLMENGDRDGAKALLVEANEIRNRIDSPATEDQLTGNGTETDFVSQTGRFTVTEDGQIKVFNLQKALEIASEKELQDEQERIDSGEGEEGTESGNNDF